MKLKSRLRFCTSLFLSSALAIGGSFWFAKPTLAAGTGADQTITNTATGSFEGATSGTTGTVTSNTVTLSVLEIAGILVTTSGTPTDATLAQVAFDTTANPLAIPGPYQGVEGINNRDIVYYDFTITNTGNSPTAIFIPDIATIGGTGGGIQRRIKVIAVDPDGASATNASIPVGVGTGGITVPTGGGITTDLGFLGVTNGYIPVNGTVTVRVAVQISGVQAGQTTTVILGDTGANNNTAGTQNQDYVASTGPANRDVFTSDLADGTVRQYLGVGGVDQTAETAGPPVNGDTTITNTRRKEASALHTEDIDNAIDYGDALETSIFDTAINSASSYANSGASHIINTALKMGTNAPDAEADGVSSVNADGDDLAGTDDEDGVTFPLPLLTSTTSYSAEVNVTNTTGSDAYLVGWIDFNNNGLFEVGEAQVLDENTGTPTVIDPITGVTGVNRTLTWTVPPGLVTGQVFYARFRLTTDLSVIGSTDLSSVLFAPQPNRPLGVGEVEDYRITVGAATPSLNVVKRITSIAGVPISGDFPSTVTATSNVGDPKWPQPPATYLRGGVDCTTLGAGATCNGVTGGRPGQEVEYTIYFLANGNDNLRNVKICDAIPANTTYVPGSMILGWDSTIIGPVLPNPDAAIGAGEAALTDGTGDDIGRFLSIGTVDPTAPTGSACETILPTPNPTGAIFVNFGATPVIPFATANGALNAANPNSAYGFIRFRVTVN